GAPGRDSPRTLRVAGLHADVGRETRFRPVRPAGDRRRRHVGGPPGTGNDLVSRLQNASSSKRSGREFAASRRKSGHRSSQPKGTESDALIYVLGPVPVHLALETYGTFDGATWIHDAAPPPRSPLEMNAKTEQ